MAIWTLLEYAAWICSAGLLGWMAFDALRVSRDYTEDLLTSSREGEIEKIAEDHEV